MLITTIEELRLCFPAHAIDDITPLSGFLENSELDFLKEKLGKGLYASLLEYYKDLDIDAYVEALQDKQDGEAAQKPYPRLLFLCQRAIAYDAFSRAIGLQVVSLSNMGVNVATTDEYGTPSKEFINDFKQTCIREAHICVNLILELLEGFCKDVAALKDTKIEEGSDDEDKQTIAGLWKQSRFYFIASGLLIPTALVLQGFVNIYENREKFIQMLPDLHYIQDELIAPLIGEDFCESLVALSRDGTDNKDLARIINRLRKCEAAFLEERTSVINISKERKLNAHDEGERHIRAAVEYCQQHQSAIDVDGVTSAPWYLSEGDEQPEPNFKNNADGNAIFVMPAMN